MSQKYKNFSRGNLRLSTCSSNLPPGVKRMGYLRKLKKLKRRFFVLHMESNYGVARLEYYSSEKKWKFGCEARRCIELKSCLNIGRKLHSKHKHVIAFYTQDDCFSVVADSAEELEDWLNDLLEVQRSYLEVDETARTRPIYEHLWQVVVDKHDLEYDRLLVGPYRVALTSKSLFLIKMNSLGENDYFEFPLMSIRRCGHSKDHFFIELGRSSVVGAGEIYMATEGTLIAQNMHETVLSAMKSSKIREDGNPFPRPRSASTSENSTPLNTRSSVGVVPPTQTVSASASSCGLSNSRERCDSLPTRPQTISGNSHNFVLSALSSPYTTSGATFRRLGSRPHSMYEWPSCNSPVTRNTVFSPNSLSSTACSSSTEDVDKMKCNSLSYYDSHSSNKTKSPNNIVNADQFTVALQSTKSKPNQTFSKMPNYLDMKTLPNPKKSENILKRDGYLDMAANSIPKGISNPVSLVSQTKLNSDHNTKEVEKAFELDKVSSLVKEEDAESNLNPVMKVKPTVIIRENNSNTLCTSELQRNLSKLAFFEERQMNLSHNAIIGSKPPVPERTYRKNEYKSNSCPPLPMRKTAYVAPPHQENRNRGDVFKFLKQSPNSQNKIDNSLEFHPENTETDDQDVFYNSNASNSIKTKSIVSPCQNTNFSCLHFGDKSKSIRSLPCAPICSAAKTPSDIEQISSNTNELKGKSISCFDKSSSIKPECSHLVLQFPVKPPKLSDQNLNVSVAKTKLDKKPDGDYINIDIKKSSPPLSHPKQGYPSLKTTAQLSAPFSDPSYTNIQFGKPIYPTPKPIPVTEPVSPFNVLLKPERAVPFPAPVHGTSEAAKSPTSSNVDPHKCSSSLTSKIRNIPNSLPAFRKQMSAPAGPLSLRPELPSPGRKSSCPVTASASMIRPPLPGPSTATMRPALLQSQTGHLRVSTSKSPDHSSVSSVSSASDEISSAHSSPKTMATTQSIGRFNASEGMYENVTFPQNPTAGSRPASTSSEEKELNYALLDLPSASDDVPRSPVVKKPLILEVVESSTYAEIDFTKSEGLKNTSGSVMREGRL